jgi:membrane associated rhomboid family serine protease
VNFLILLAVFGLVAYRVLPAADRTKYLASAIALLQEVKTAFTQRRPQYETFKDALRARTPYAIVAPAFVALNAAFFCAVVFGPGTMHDPATLVGLGASLGTRTSNGEWWRLLTAIFLPNGLLHLVFTAAVLLHAGIMLERLVGRWAFAAVYLAAGVFSGLVNMSSRPVVVTVSGSGALFGLYGLMLAALAWQQVGPRSAEPVEPVGPLEPGRGLDEGSLAPVAPSAKIPLIAIKRIGAVGAMFALFSAITGSLTSGELTGFVVGLLYGLVIGWRVSERPPIARLVGAAAAGALAAAVVAAMPLRNIDDVAPEIGGVVSTEERTATKYRAAFDAFKKGKINAEALAQVADRTIVPELQAIDARLSALKNVPAEHQRIVADAREYLRLRTKSWRARAEVVRRTNPDPRHTAERSADASGRIQAEAKFRSDLMAMGNAEGFERASLQAFQRVSDWKQ